MISRPILWFAMSIALGITNHAWTQDQMPTKVTSIEGITEYQLGNGLQVLLFPDSSKPTVTVNMTIFVGSRHEGYGEAGMAHLLEHMLFKGTSTHAKIPELLQARGAQFNGTTWLDRTNYYETLPAKEDNLEFAIRLEADRLVNSLIRGEDLQSEFTVVRSEFESGENSPLSVLQQRMLSAAFQWHNYGNSTIGNRSDIERVPVTNLRNFYRRFYRPDNVMLVVAGKLDVPATLKLIQTYFGVLENPATPLERTYTVEPPQDGERTTVVRRVGENQYVGAAYHVPAGGDPQYPAVEVLASLLSTEPSGRLYKSLVLAKKASTVIGGSFALHDPGVAFFGAEVAKDQSLEEARAALLATLEGIGQEKITDEEVNRSKVELLKNRELRSTNSTALATELSEWAAQGDWRLYFLHRDLLEKVDASDVQKAAERYLIRNNRTVGLFIPTTQPEKATIPEKPNLKELLANYQGRASVTEGEEFNPTPVAIEQRTQRGNLPCGIQYALLPKKTRGETVNISLHLRFGNEKTLFGKTSAIELMGEMMLRGTQSYDYQKLKDTLDRLRANVRISCRPGLLQMQLRTKREYLPELLPVVQEMIRKPRFDANELEVIRTEQITGLQAQLSEPDALAPLTVVRTLSPYVRGDARYVSSIAEEMEDVKKVTIEDIRQVYQTLLGGNVGELVAVGDFDIDTLKTQFNSMLEGWTSAIVFERVPSPANTKIDGDEIKIETPDKANSVYYASQQYAMRDNDPKYPALAIGNYILGAGALSSRLGDRVRQKEGLSYGISSGLNSHPIDPRTSLTIFAITNPSNRDKLVKVIREEIDKLLESGITADELAKAKKGFLESLQVARSNDQSLVQALLGSLFAKRTLAYEEEMESSIANLTVDEVNDALRQYVVPDRLVIATAGDFANSKEPSKAKD